MKTSNQLVLAVVVIILISLIGYDLALRAEYRKGEYKSRFYGMEKLPAFSGYTSIDNRAANLVSVDLEQGKDAAIWTLPDWKDHYKVYKNGTTLVIEVIAEQAKNIKPYHLNRITIVCPSIEKISTRPYLLTNSSGYKYNSEGTTTLKGFDLQNLVLNIGKNSDVVLNANKIGQLQAKVGENLSQRSNLTINSDNQIGTATLNVLGKNRLQVDNPVITTKHFNISDSATVSASGRFLTQIQK